MKKAIVGILAHVDAGKTTLSEAMLYLSGTIKKLGRVDHKDAFLDTYLQERQRGITIFSKQARFNLEDFHVTLIDTPGHVDFSAEMERTLQVLDYAILVINGREGVQGHTQTLAKLLKHYRVPTFIFVNKSDLGVDKEKINQQLKKHVSENCVDFSVDFSDNFYEDAACLSENLMEEFLENGQISDEAISSAIASAQLIPVFYGSALKLEKVDEFMSAINRYMVEKEYGQEFGARVYKVNRDKQGNRLTYLKVTGGSLKVKDVVATDEEGEKINQIRIYSGEKFTSADSVSAGEICAVTGLEKSFAGQGIGSEEENTIPVLEPVLTYKVILPEGANLSKCYEQLKTLDEEEPELHVIWDEILKEIQIKLMGKIQLEVIQQLVADRFDFSVQFDQGRISYKETVVKAGKGIGHFEPLRHYAEAHLLVEPGPRGSGITVESKVSADDFDMNWQRLVYTHIAEKVHCGVLTNMPLTDLKISILGGRGHLKHTEGGDFRQATYRALRNALMHAKCQLLEPWYDYTIDVPADLVGRAMSDIKQMSGTFDQPEIVGDTAILKGQVPISEMKDYAVTLASYTKGRGNLHHSLAGYMPCHNEQQVIAEYGYDPLNDPKNTPDSVFCKNGAGFNVAWNHVKEYAHVVTPDLDKEFSGVLVVNNKNYGNVSAETEKELDAIFERTYGPKKDRNYIHQQVIRPVSKITEAVDLDIKDEYLLVDGYNIIYAWEELKELAKVNFDGARNALLDILSNYQGYKKCKIIAVFDAYKVKGDRRQEMYGDIEVVYTKEAETADTYIERFAKENAKDYYVRVATSDSLEQMIILGHGAFKVSATEFYEEVKIVEDKISELIAKYNRQSYLNSRVTLGDKMGQ
ncbi:MAG: translation factor GTPase family protein [Eubacterium sp.]|nr:translation factor GTPase family protein [Eubacterium sp.]